VSHRTDEDFINRSLLDSLDAQADAEPVSSSDSEAAPAASFGSSSNSSSGSPSVPYHISTMQSQQHPPLPRSDSPSNIINSTNLHHNINQLKSAPESIFTPQNTHHNMYNNIHVQPEYSDLEGQKQQQSKVNGFAAASAGPYRTSTAFNAFSNTRMRHQHTPGSSIQYREAPQSAFNHYPTAADVFPVQQLTSPTQQQQPSSASHVFDVHQSRGFDFGAGTGSQSNVTTPLSKPSQYGVDPYGTTPPSSALLQSHQVGGILTSGITNQPLASPGLHPQPSQHQQPLDGYQHHQSQTYLNGLHLQSQTPYGPHLQTGPGSVGAGQNNAPGAVPSNMSALNGIGHLTGANNSASQNNVQEEISTIFVVGFPEDMQVRSGRNERWGFNAYIFNCRNESSKTCSLSPPGLKLRL
jgi:hypothetical protein